jgi:hypothetical protein
MYNRIKNTKNSSPRSIKDLSKAFGKGSTICNSEVELEDAISTTVLMLDNKGQDVQPATEYVIAYSDNSPNDKSPAELWAALRETFNVSGYDWENVGMGIELIAKYSAMCKKGKSVLELTNAVSESFEYMHKNNVSFESFKSQMDKAHQTEIKNAVDKHYTRTEVIKTNHTGLVKTIMLIKEKVLFELYQNPPSFGVQELCNRITNNISLKPELKYNQDSYAYSPFSKLVPQNI